MYVKNAYGPTRLLLMTCYMEFYYQIQVFKILVALLSRVNFVSSYIETNNFLYFIELITINLV